MTLNLEENFKSLQIFLLSQPDFLNEDILGMLALFFESLDSKLLQISIAIENEKEIQTI